MAIISSQKTTEKEKVKFDISSSLLKDIKSYMKFADIKDIDHFFSEAANFVFSKDKAWKEHLKNSKKEII